MKEITKKKAVCRPPAGIHPRAGSSGPHSQALYIPIYVYIYLYIPPSSQIKHYIACREIRLVEAPPMKTQVVFFLTRGPRSYAAFEGFVSRNA